nr:hypothetical protein [Tanacetum cinerariifolium]
MIRYSALFDNDKQHRKQIADQEVLFDKMSVELVELDNHVRDLKNTVLEKDFKISELEDVSLKILSRTMEVAFYPGLHFFLDCVLSSTAFCLFEDHLLRFAKDKLFQNQNCVAFCLRPNGEALRKCILSGPYKPTTVLVQAVKATDDSPAVPEHTTPEWSRFVTIVKQQHKLDEVSYHKLFDILKQYQNEVNELRTEKLARNANPLALVTTAQADRDPYYQTSRSHRSSAPSSKPSIPSRSHRSTRHKGKEIAKPITP